MTPRPPLALAVVAVLAVRQVVTLQVRLLALMQELMVVAEAVVLLADLGLAVTEEMERLE